MSFDIFCQWGNFMDADFASKIGYRRRSLRAKRSKSGIDRGASHEIAASCGALFAMIFLRPEVSFHHFEDLYGSTCGRVTIATCAAPQLDDMLLQCIGLVAVSLLP